MARPAANLLRSYSAETGGDSRKIRLGLLVLALATVVVLNVGIYQGAQNQMAHDRWGDLASSTDAARERLRAMFQTVDRQIRFAMDQPGFAQRAHASLDGSLDNAGRGALQEELNRIAGSFLLHHAMLIAPDGRVLASSNGASNVWTPGDRSRIAQRALPGPVRMAADVHGDDNGALVLEIAVPVRGAASREQVPVLVAGLDARQVLLPLVGVQPGRDITPTLYLVRREAGQITYLTPLSGETLPPAADATDPTVRAAFMAASGVESNLEVQLRGDRALSTTSRYLPELDWGLVGQIDRAEMLAGMRATFNRLLAFDGVLVAGALLVWWLWRRNYQRGLARQEEAMTSRHSARIQAIFDTAFDAILTYGADGRILTANRAAESLFGRRTAEIEGLPIQRLLHWGMGAGRANRTDLPTPGVVLVAEAMRADGEVFPAEFSSGAAGTGDELMYAAIVRDISDRVEADKRIRAFAEGLEVSNRRLEEMNAQLEEASRLKSEFLANTSHELRTPLNGIIGFLQLVLDGMCENPEEEKEFQRQALQCSRHLLGLINDVLDIAKIEAGKLALDLERIDVDALFAEVHTVTHVQAQQKGISLHFDFPPDADLALKCDFAKTKQVLINLIGNSLKFTSRGSIAVRALPQPDVGHVMFEVVDTGIGIPHEQQKRIFEKFAQADGSTTRKYGGTGLGLAISRSLVELQGGIIGVHSDGPGKGTRMYFSIPIWHEQQESPTVIDETHLKQQIEGPDEGALVLVVEDDPSFRKFLIAALHHHGYRTVQANHAEAGWTLVKRLRPAVVVLDYALSCVEGAHLRTGWDLAVKMTTEPSTRHIALVFVTGFDHEVREKLRSTAFSRQPIHLMRPIDARQLVSRIETLITSVQGRSARVLLADDDPTVAAFVRKVLPEDRFHLEVAANGDEALHAMRTQPRGFDLLLLDLMMPEVSGYDVLREMTLTGLGADVPVLVLTNFPEARNSEEQRLLQDGLVLDVVAKTAVHDNPMLLAHLVEWHLQVTHDEADDAADPGLQEAA
jgi:PAS domain S-box-containing protein